MVSPQSAKPAPEAGFRLGGLTLRPAVVLRLALLATGLAYLRTITFDFVFDDFAEIVLNPRLQSWSNIPGYFLQQAWSVVDPAWQGSYYRPVIWVWLTLGYHLFDSIPGYWHLAGIAMHLLATVLVYWLGRRLLGDPRAAALAALLFGVYPVHVEDVAWVTSTGDLLFAILFLSSFLCYLKWRQDEPRRRAWFLLSLLLFALGMLTKETAAAVAGLVFCYEWLFAGGLPSWRKRLSASLAWSLPYLILVLGYLGARWLVLQGFAHPTHPASAREVLLTTPLVLWFYLKKLVWPFGLSPLYDIELVKRATWASVGVPVLGIVLAGAVAWLAARKSRVRQFLLLWIGGTLLPALAGLAVFQPHDYAHDRQLYIPSVAFVMLLALAIRRIQLPRSAEGAPWGQLAVALVLAMVFGVVTFRYSACWENELVLWQRAVARAPHNILAKEYLAAELFARRDYPASLQLYQQLLAADPDSARIQLNMGLSYAYLDRLAEAEPYFARAIELQEAQGVPPPASAFYYLGRLRLQEGKLAEAEADFRRAVELRPYIIGYRIALDGVLQREGKE